MARRRTPTATERFFLRKYGSSALPSAVEEAARLARQQLFPGTASSGDLPIDIYKVAESLQVRVHTDRAHELDGSWGALLVNSAGTGAHLGQRESTSARDRFTLAHELGHSLFWENGKHVVPSIARSEHEAEERICDQFAAALLMPTENVARVARELTGRNAWSLLLSLERAARRFEVSIPAVISRLGNVRMAESPRLMLLCLSEFANHYTGTQECLRVRICSPLGGLRNMRTWFNRSAAGVGLTDAKQLFGLWAARLASGVEETGGRYGLDSNEHVARANQHILEWQPETLHLSVCQNEKWSKKSVPMRVASCLYARKKWTRREAYVVSLVMPPDDGAHE